MSPHIPLETLVRIYICSTISAFLFGFATALIMSYPIPSEALYVCVLGIVIMIWACLFGVWAIIDWSHLRGRIRLDELVEVMADELEAERRLKLVDRD